MSLVHSVLDRKAHVMEKDGPKTPGAFRLLFSHKPLEDISGPTDADMRSPQPGNDVSKSTSNTTKSRPNRRRPVARSPGRNFAIKLPNILYFAHHAIDKAKYPKSMSLLMRDIYI